MNNIAVIVPYRNQEGQNREYEKSVFIPHMIKMFENLKTTKEIDDYHIYIVEQNISWKKFNRGLLLNIGVALSDKKYSTVILHDIDLLPQEDVYEWYAFQTQKHPIHIAACWDRYGSDKKYFGGIVSFNRDIFTIINGFSNTFWGWGGEDNTLLDRCKMLDLYPKKVKQGTLLDIETNDKGKTMDLQQKLDYLRKYRYWKCNDRWEQRDNDKWTWRTNGLNQVIHRNSELYTLDTTLEERYITHYQVTI